MDRDELIRMFEGHAKMYWDARVPRGRKSIRCALLTESDAVDHLSRNLLEWAALYEYLYGLDWDDLPQDVKMLIIDYLGVSA